MNRKLGQIKSSLVQYKKRLNYNIKNNNLVDEELPRDLVRIKERRLDGEADEYQDESNSKVKKIN